jgi:hypothetical protein
VLALNARDVTVIRLISERLWRGTIKSFSMSERNPKPCLKLRNPLNPVIYFLKFLSPFLGSLKIYYSWDHVSKISHVLAMKLKSRHLEHRFSHRETNAIFRVYDTQEWNSSGPRVCWMEWFLEVMMQPRFPFCTPMAFSRANFHPKHVLSHQGSLCPAYTESMLKQFVGTHYTISYSTMCRDPKDHNMHVPRP